MFFNLNSNYCLTQINSLINNQLSYMLHINLMDTLFWYYLPSSTNCPTFKHCLLPPSPYRPLPHKQNTNIQTHEYFPNLCPTRPYLAAGIACNKLTTLPRLEPRTISHAQWIRTGFMTLINWLIIITSLPGLCFQLARPTGNCEFLGVPTMGHDTLGGSPGCWCWFWWRCWWYLVELGKTIKAVGMLWQFGGWPAPFDGD